MALSKMLCSYCKKKKKAGGTVFKDVKGFVYIQVRRKTVVLVWPVASLNAYRKGRG